MINNSLDKNKTGPSIILEPQDKETCNFIYLKNVVRHILDLQSYERVSRAMLDVPLPGVPIKFLKIKQLSGEFP